MHIVILSSGTDLKLIFLLVCNQIYIIIKILLLLGREYVLTTVSRNHTHHPIMALLNNPRLEQPDWNVVNRGAIQSFKHCSSSTSQLHPVSAVWKKLKMFLPHPRVKVSIVGSLRDREVACSASDRQGLNFESCVWRTVSSQSFHHPQEVLLAQFSLYVHKGGLKPDSFHFILSKS